MIHLYTGNGKGKTTAAIGLAVRATGRGKRVLLAQFMKGNETGELLALEKLPQITFLRCEKNYGFYKEMSAQDKSEITAEHNRILDRIGECIFEGNCDMILLDEITYPVNFGLVDAGKVKNLLALMKADARDLELVMTGRDPAEFLLESADYVTEMECLRHPYEKGVKARIGIEY